MPPDASAFERERAALYREALEIQRATLPEQHLYTATSLVGMGEALMGSGRPEAAEVHLREALGMLDGLLEPPHWRLVEARTLLARAAAAQGRNQEAESYAAAAVESGGGDGRRDAEQVARARETLEAIREAGGSSR